MTLIRDAVRRGIRYLPPRVEMLLRAARHRRALAGFYAPGRALSALVPVGKLAIDAGANVGDYSYWIARSASEVVAFEPQPGFAKRLAASGVHGLTVHNCALSDACGVADLHIPPPSHPGEASLRELDAPVDTVQVPLATLDSFELADVGFFKIDVEGHEEPLLHGAEETLRRSSALVYIEERHNPGGLARILKWLGDLGYTDVQFRQHGAMHPFAEFDVERDQMQQQPRTAAYANNFMFTRPSR
jgi:FkbM family methyltransferase